MIPKLFHYIWVGDNPLPASAQRFIDAAKRLHPDYQFHLWTEENLALDAPFVRRAYARKAWAFVSDYCRFQILLQHGGIYCDTDTEVLKCFDPLLDCGGFAGLNKQGDAIYCGVIGATPNHPLMQDILNRYDALRDSEFPTSPRMLTAAFKDYRAKDFTVHPYYYFYPAEQGRPAPPELMRQAYATHHWDESWRRFVPLRRFLRRTGVMGVYHSLKNKNESVAHYAQSQ